jgi:hypothetical protein
VGQGGGRGSNDSTNPCIKNKKNIYLPDLKLAAFCARTHNMALAGRSGARTRAAPCPAPSASTCRSSAVAGGGGSRFFVHKRAALNIAYHNVALKLKLIRLSKSKA